MTEIRGSIKGRVAKVLNSRELVINRGSTEGVTEGMKFAVLDPQAFDIRDPESGETLGSLWRPKVRVHVVKVEPRLSLARTYEVRRVGGVGLSGVASLFAPSGTQYVTLEKASGSYEELSEEESYVKVGDPVEQIIETGTQ